jgi:branched-chain amino acid transport system permease protein
MSVLVVQQNATLALAHAAVPVLEVGNVVVEGTSDELRANGIRPQIVPRLLMLIGAFTWTEFAQQLAAGIREGAIYAGLALAIVIIYRTTRVINFAQGEMATFTTFISWSLMNHGLSFWTAFPIVLAIAFTGGVAIERIVIRPVEDAPVLTIVIVTLGLALLLNGLMSVIWGGANRQFRGPFSTRTIDLAGVPISVQDIGIVLVSIGLVVLLALFFRLTKLGLALRAAPSTRFVAARRHSRRLDARTRLGIAAVLGAVAG